MSEPASNSPPPSARRKTIRGVISLILLSAALWFLWRTGNSVGWGNLGRRIAEASPAILTAAFLVNLLRYVAWASRWRILMTPVVRVPWWPAFKALMASVFFNTVIPGARAVGGLVRARYLSKSTGIPNGPLYGGAVVDQMGYSLVSMGLGMVFLPAAFAAGRTGGGVWFAIPAVLIVVVIFVVAWRKREALMERLRRRMPAAAAAVKGAFTAARTLLSRPRSWTVMALGGTVVWAGNVLTFQLTATALGADIGFYGAAAAFLLGSLAGVATGTPGGAGATEAAAIAPLLALGVPQDLALASVLLARSIHYVSAILLGGACALAGR